MENLLPCNKRFLMVARVGEYWEGVKGESEGACPVGCDAISAVAVAVAHALESVGLSLPSVLKSAYLLPRPLGMNTSVGTHVQKLHL